MLCCARLEHPGYLRVQPEALRVAPMGPLDPNPLPIAVPGDGLVAPVIRASAHHAAVHTLVTVALEPTTTLKISDGSSIPSSILDLANAPRVCALIVSLTRPALGAKYS